MWVTSRERCLIAGAGLSHLSFPGHILVRRCHEVKDAWKTEKPREDFV